MNKNCMYAVCEDTYVYMSRELGRFSRDINTGLPTGRTGDLTTSAKLNLPMNAANTPTANR